MLSHYTLVYDFHITVKSFTWNDNSISFSNNENLTFRLFTNFLPLTLYKIWYEMVYVA